MNYSKLIAKFLDLIKIPIASLIKALIIILLFLPLIGVKLFEMLEAFFKKRNFKEKKSKKSCDSPLPEEIMRRPDPCIYSQAYLYSQDLPVSWDNPDIWFNKAITPQIIEPANADIEPNTDYIINVRAHNASTDPAVGVKTRLLYKTFRDGNLIELPIELDAMGQEAFRIANIPPMGNKVVQFNWRTPAVFSEYKFSFKAILSHPLDTNPSNNIGEDIKHAVTLDPGQSAKVILPITNTGLKDQAFSVSANSYRINQEKHTLELKKNLGTPKYSTIQNILFKIPIINIGYKKSFKSKSIIDKLGLTFIPKKYILKTKYSGFEALKEKLQRQISPLPDGVSIEYENFKMDTKIDAKTFLPVECKIIVDEKVKSGSEFLINLICKNTSGKNVSGLTIFVTVN